MYINKKNKLNQKLVEQHIKEILQYLKDQVTEEHFTSIISSDDGTVREIKSDKLQRVDMLLQEGNERKNLKQLASDFIKTQGYSNKVSPEFIYKNLRDLISQAWSKKLDLVKSEDLIRELRTQVDQEIKSTKRIVLPLVGAHLDRGEICHFAGVEFFNSLDFLDKANIEISETLRDLRLNTIPIIWLLLREINCVAAIILLRNSFQDIDTLKALEYICNNCDLIAKININNKDDKIAKDIAFQAIQRICTIIQYMLPRCGDQYSFFRLLGEEYLEDRTFFMFILDSKHKNRINTVVINRSRNHFMSPINLLKAIDYYRHEIPWFNACEQIIYKFINEGKLNEFEQRIWTALHWLGEAMNEKEINTLIIKYSTCLEALFNSNQGNISQQIPEFAAHVVGFRETKEIRIKIYENIRKLYELRSKAVHGSSLVDEIDELLLDHIKQVCEISLFRMAIYSIYKDFQGKNGYKQFVAYLLKEYRFSG